MKLRTKFAIVLLVMTLVLSAGVYGGLELYKGRLVGQAQTDVNETTRLTAQQIDARIEGHRDFIGFVASRPEAAQFNRSGRYLNELVDNSRFFAAQLVAANGTIVDFHGDITQEIRQETIGSDVGNRTYVRRARAGEVYMSEPEYTNATGKYLVIFSAPIFEDREIKGVLAAAVYVDRQTFFGMLGPLERADQTVTVSAGDVELYGPQKGFDRAIAHTETVESTGWSVTVTRDRSGLIGQLRDLALAQGVGLFLVLVSVVLFGMWEYRTAFEQTERLLGGFEALSEGEFDRRLSLSAAEEWEQISDGFNELATELAAREVELREREQRLEVLNRALRHDLRNQTNVILGYAERIREEAGDERTSQAALDIIDRVMALNRLGDKAREIEAAMDSPAETRTVEVVETVERVLEEIAAAYPRMKVTSSLPDAAWVWATPSLELAIRNLCENACEHNSSDEPELDVSVEADGSTVYVRVADNGPGIPEQERTVVSEGRETPLEHGSGLGLWLVRWTVERSGGELRFDRNEPEGTVVVLELSRAHADPGDDAAEGTTDELDVESVANGGEERSGEPDGSREW